jgi:hypothetical protein
VKKCETIREARDVLFAAEDALYELRVNPTPYPWIFMQEARKRIAAKVQKGVE